jgi:hypothetical protein
MKNEAAQRPAVRCSDGLGLVRGSMASQGKLGGMYLSMIYQGPNGHAAGAR